MDNAIEIKNLTKTFPGFTLEGLNLTVPGGTILGLIGENGAGKSTTIKCILGLLRPDGGEISVLGGSNTDPAVRARVGVVLDECPFHDALKAPDVGRVLSGVYPTWDSALFERYLHQFELPGDKPIKGFSRGMKMKLSIAAALAHRPNLLVLDEPTSGLDPVVRSEILDEFLSFIQDEDHAILISSHITSDLEKAADYIAYLHKGRLSIAGEKDVLLAEHGRLACTAADLERVDPAYLVGVNRTQFGCEALIRNKKEFVYRYPQLSVEPATLEEIMVFTTKGEQE